MKIAAKVTFGSRFSSVRGVFWATIFAWAASSIIAVSFEMLAAARAIVFSTLLLSVYCLSKLARQPHRVPLRMTWAATALLAIWYILYCLFGDVDVDAILFHLNYDVSSGGVPRETLKSALIAALPFVWLVISWNSLARMSRGLATANRLLPMGLLAVNPLIWIGAQETLASSPVSALNLQPEYVVPVVHAAKDGSAKNLIHIFVESAELTLWDDERFGNVAQPLKRLSDGGWAASNIAQVELTGWTLAGQVASTCGVPLFSLGVITKNSFDLVEQILPEARCLERFRAFLNRVRFPKQVCSDSVMLAGWRPASHDGTDIE
jgi:phosphoglycerol transferase